MKRSWSETQAIAERAALGLGVPFAQAARFGGAAARHLAEARPAADIFAVLEGSDALVELSLAIETAIEAASLGRPPTRVEVGPQSLVVSFLQSLPCAARIEPLEAGIKASVILAEPQSMPRPARINVPDELWERFEELAALTYVPDSAASRAKGAGAGLMELD